MQCYKVIYGYMGFAMFNVFFFLTGALIIQLLRLSGVHMDLVSFCFLLFNFSVGGLHWETAMGFSVWRSGFVLKGCVHFDWSLCMLGDRPAHAACLCDAGCGWFSAAHCLLCAVTMTALCISVQLPSTCQIIGCWSPSGCRQPPSC